MRDLGRAIALEIEFERDGVRETIYPALLVDADARVLVDCGYAGMLPSLADALSRHTLRFDDITHIAVTHHDHDHYGALREIVDRFPHIRTVASALDAPYIAGREKSLRLQQAERLHDALPTCEQLEALAFRSTLERVAPCDIDIAVRDGDTFPWCGGTQIVATPGHMPGHISLYLRQHRTIIAGDALVAVNGRLRVANPHYALDIDAARRSAKKLRASGADRFICYHGGSVQNG